MSSFVFLNTSRNQEHPNGTAYFLLTDQILMVDFCFKFAIKLTPISNQLRAVEKHIKIH